MDLTKINPNLAAAGAGTAGVQANASNASGAASVSSTAPSSSSNGGMVSSVKDKSGRGALSGTQGHAAELGGKGANSISNTGLLSAFEGELGIHEGPKISLLKKNRKPSAKLGPGCKESDAYASASEQADSHTRGESYLLPGDRVGHKRRRLQSLDYAMSFEENTGLLDKRMKGYKVSSESESDPEQRQPNIKDILEGHRHEHGYLLAPSKKRKRSMSFEWAEETAKRNDGTEEQKPSAQGLLLSISDARAKEALESEETAHLIPLSLRIEPITGHPFRVSLYEEDFLGDLKIQIFAQTGICPDTQIIMFREENLCAKAENTSLKEAGLANDARLALLVNVHSGFGRDGKTDPWWLLLDLEVETQAQSLIDEINRELRDTERLHSGEESGFETERESESDDDAIELELSNIIRALSPPSGDPRTPVDAQIVDSMKAIQLSSAAPLAGSPSHCQTCSKKLRLTTGFECKCGQYYCSEHRYSDRHACPFDYHRAAQALLGRHNPAVMRDKI